MDLLETIEFTRAEIASTKGEIEDTRDSRLPAEETTKRIVQAVDTIAFAIDREVRTAVAAVAEPNGSPIEAVRRFLTLRTEYFSAGGSAQRTVNTKVDSADLLCWLFRNQIKVGLCDAAEHADFVTGLPAAERPARLIELQKTLHELEVAEERLVIEAEDLGLEVYRRADVDAAIVLNYQPGDLADTDTVERAPKVIWEPPHGAASAEVSAASLFQLP